MYRSLYVVMGIAATVLLAQAQSGKPAWTPPRAADGHPDLQGSWANNIATPLERPRELANHPYLTEDEVAAMKKKAHEIFNDGKSDAAFGDTVFLTVYANVKGTRAGFTSTDGETGDYSSVWTVERDWDNRTSLINEPSDGRIPAMTAAGQARREANAAARTRPAAGPEDRALQERCITYGSPQLVAGYQSGYTIVQNAHSVVIVNEMIHDSRVVSLDNRPHLPSTVHQWLGDSVGRWEGDTLIIDTTNYKSRSFMSISSEQMHVIERFTRTAPDTLQYQITIDDPGTWTKPWTAMIPLKKSTDPYFEYACHEGNIGLAGILAGARADEHAAALGSR